MEGPTAVARYVRQRVALGHYTETTRRTTLSILENWCRFVSDWTAPTPDELIEWTTVPRSPDGKHRRASCLRSFYKWAAEHRWCDDRVALLVPSIRGSDKRPKPIPDEVLAGILARAGGRDRDAILLGRFAGFRAMEIAAVHREHLVDGMLWTRGKGAKERWVPAHPEVERVVSSSRGFVFPSSERPGQPVLAQTMTKWLGRALPSPYTAHTLRHAFCTDFYNATNDIVLTADVMGHASTRTTERYIKVRADRASAVVRNMRLVA